jgi:hypothetical protein
MPDAPHSSHRIAAFFDRSIEFNQRFPAELVCKQRGFRQIAIDSGNPICVDSRLTGLASIISDVRFPDL